MDKMAKGLVCLDTDICVDFLRKKDPGFTLFLKLLERFEPCLTTVSTFELYLGHLKMKRRERIDEFLAQFIILPFDLKASLVSANIQALLNKKGESIGIPDALIAGICIANNIPLLTLNAKHFSRVTGLKLIPINW
jgi:tRNA(fMet)-specific endonuclease VapC